MELDPGAESFPFAGLWLAAEHEVGIEAYRFFYELFRLHGPYVQSRAQIANDGRDGVPVGTRLYRHKDFWPVVIVRYESNPLLIRPRRGASRPR